MKWSRTQLPPLPPPEGYYQPEHYVHVWVCMRCGAAVADEIKHNDWHALQNKFNFMAQTAKKIGDG